MITCQNNVYHLRTDSYSCLLRINDWGLVEQLHFGAPVRTEDAESFAELSDFALRFDIDGEETGMYTDHVIELTLAGSSF